MLSFLSKVFILGISFKLHASFTEFCYKCDGRCSKPPNAEWCNASGKNSVCMVRRNPVEKTETRSCLNPSTQSANISACNKTDDALCKICEGNFCNVPLKRKGRGASRCYYCDGKCKNPLETSDCYYLQNVCITIVQSTEEEYFNWGSYQYEKRTVILINRDCRGVQRNQTPNTLCDAYKDSPNTNCTVCNSTKCNRLPYDPPDPTPPQLTANFANVFECCRILIEFSIYILTFIVK